MSTELENLVAARVAVGRKVLAQYDPEWFMKIDLEAFDIRNGLNCILGQLFGSFYKGEDWLWKNGLEVVECGFDEYIDAYPIFDLLQEEWEAWVAYLQSQYGK